MKTRFVALTLAACISLAAHTVLAQYATVPVGFIKTTISSGTASGPTLTAISIPFYGTSNGASAYAGAISAVTSSTVSISSSAAQQAGWANSQFSSGTPYLARIKSAATKPGTGFFFLITANTTSQITVDSRGLDLQTLVDPNDTFEIVTANTMGSTFGTIVPDGTHLVGTTGVIALQTGTSANGSDNVIMWGVPPNAAQGTPPTWLTYYFDTDANYWVLDGNGNNFNNSVIFPDEGFFIRRRATSTVDVVVSGAVPSTNEKTEMLGPYKSFVANRFPINMTLKANDNTGLNLDSVPGWGKGTSPNGPGVDNVLVWGVAPNSAPGTRPTWLTFYYDTDAGSWILNGNGNPQDTYPISAGSAVFIYRRTTASGTGAYISQALPYNLNN